MDAIMNLVKHLPAILTTLMYIWARAKVAASPNAKPGWLTTSFWLTAAIDICTALKDVWPQ